MAKLHVDSPRRRPTDGRKPLATRDAASCPRVYTGAKPSEIAGGRTQLVGTQTVTAKPSQPRIDRFTLQGQNAENAFMDSTQWFLAAESFQGFNAQSELPQG